MLPIMAAHVSALAFSSRCKSSVVIAVSLRPANVGKICLYSAVRYDICADTPICGCLYTSYQLSAYRSKSIPSGAAFAPVTYFSRAAALAASSSFFVRPDTYLTMLFPLASVPTVIFAR